MFEGDLVEGELEIGQVAGIIHDIKSSESIINEMIQEFEASRKSLSESQF